ncbi:MAG TPA: hypothetical protein PLI47_00150 [Bacteroidia bacterium]|nr:hypothetical protein [Bacteroidota bacterium]MBK8585092.1 hypothetical protein [Bacteroidota bacterium]MBP9790644.1 hypothetical protein [Bacteroidia bacterium]HQV99139.1 hypothetical protein [Bacteroidia bacterium]HQW21682.1 hypothetical protein [Bacteroidia bacterium]
MNKILFILIAGIFICEVSAQDVLFPLSRDMNTRIESFINADTTGFHSSVKPYLLPEMRKAVPVDSIFSPIVKDGKFTRTWVGRKLFKEHLLFVDEDDIVLSVDPVFNLQYGKEQQSSPSYFVNTRGLLVQGNVKDKFYFYTGFHENQARYVPYIDSTVHTTLVVPGQGIVKFNPEQVFDFSQSIGGIGYILNKHFDFLFAQDKNFIGDGYRSLLLSDNSYSYPFLRINMTFWKFRYTVLYTVYRDLQSAPDPNVGYLKKYNTVHNLDLNIGKKNKLTVSIFETVMWAPSASRGYELAYLNPVLFIRPVENSLGSPDNVLLGSNVRWKINQQNTLYGQVMLDELLLDEVRAGEGWWGNKQGFQLGYKSSNLFKVKNLNFQTEYNWVRPYTYQHRTSSQSYNQYNQALAHPLGANFSESVTFVNYRYKNLFAELKVQIATMGRDTADLNLGNDIFKSYETRNSDYGHYMFDGLKSDLNTVDLRVNYLVNPKYNFVIEAGVIMRNFENVQQNDRSSFFYFGMRTSLENYYFDF